MKHSTWTQASQANELANNGTPFSGVFHLWVLLLPHNKPQQCHYPQFQVMKLAYTFVHGSGADFKRMTSIAWRLSVVHHKIQLYLGPASPRWQGNRRSLQCFSVHYSGTCSFCAICAHCGWSFSYQVAGKARKGRDYFQTAGVFVKVIIMALEDKILHLYSWLLTWPSHALFVVR